ncbi:MAG: RHS repeat-associated core domain-containing protein [Clostridiaceae bacterium]|nr:RHS repeat-associated core domain-containing protein [Clostridiaceae bacterium]
MFASPEDVVQEYSNGRLTKFDGNVINYDSVGNPTNYNGNTLTWLGKQLKKFRSSDGSYTEYEYDINGLRTQKRKYTSSNELEYAVDYVWSDGKIAYQSLNYPLTITINGNDVTQNLKIDSKFIYADGEQTPCAIMMNGQEFLLVRNLLGDVTALILADSGETIAEFTYSPWGEVTYNINDEQYNTNLTFPSANFFSQYQELQAYRKLLQAIVTALCPVSYRGYNYDYTTGLYYLQARYYNPAWGRFINADDTSILLSTTGTLHGANLYAYCNNNPINKVDYSGKDTNIII